MCACDELARDGFECGDVGDIAGSEVVDGVVSRVCVVRVQRVGRRWRDEVGAAVTSREAFGDYGGDGDEVGETFGAAEVRGWDDGGEKG